VRAPTPGSGKSYLVDLASAIATGQRCPVIAAGRDEAETEKRLGAALLAGYPIISIDNLNGELGGDALCQAVERPVFLMRVLGFSEVKRIESQATIFATGNNIQPTGDVVRRTLLCSLDPQIERPELREFSVDPLSVIFADRGCYIAAILTIVRAYIVAGRPDPRPALASFQEWSLLVRSALVWLGEADPVETIETARGEDSALVHFQALMAEMALVFGVTERLTAGEIKARAEVARLGALEHPELHQLLLEVAGTQGAIDPKRLGRFLSRHSGRIVDGLKLTGDTDNKRKQKVWSIRRV
jgi:putative DNA primase/helicase